MAIQPDLQRCQACGGAAVVLPTLSPWEFQAMCQACRAETVISWSHEAAPPGYQVTPADADVLPLFRDV